MITFNGNIPVVLDTETTGLEPGFHEIVQVAALPLDENLDPIDNHFEMLMRPEFPERAHPMAFKANGLSVEQLAGCPSQLDVADAFLDWTKTLGLPQGKKITVICHNAVFDVPLVKMWLGGEAYNETFFRRSECTMHIAQGMNHRAAWKARPTPFPNVSLEGLCNKFGISNEGAHDALVDVIRTAKVFRELLRYE